ncbi:MAG: S-adenosylmethionine:tRNA ribosyltransferase-isomerase, partial [Alphaproteobacteria bacterium]
MKVDDFDFELPVEAIAQRPVSPRDRARLVRIEDLSDHLMRDLPDFLEPGDIVVSNDTRVIPARLKGKRGEANIEVTLHKRRSADSWDAFARPAKKLKPDDIIDFAEHFQATVTAKGDG